ncbi:hypothetical protein GGX14DRAFT_433679 [Mycena pura]|uniref:NTF2-like protein n=1 Tax=Mycena pura TaxID=153505 RepID=A0AAD6YIQ6_9AGAR|nr:hypothetical protein GGX14DRAFT_433679 [Mycena pura]
MFSSPTPAPGSKALAANALRGAGLMVDRDTTMRDVSDKPSGRKATKHRSHRVKAIYDLNDRGSGSSRMLSSRIADPGPSDPLSIRGASRTPTGTRPRRNAVSGGVPVAPPALTHASPTLGRISAAKSSRTLDHWSEFVKKRYDLQTKCLNLDSMHEDSLLRKYNLPAPGIGGGTAREAGVIFKLASRLKPPVETVSLANNGLSGQHLTYLDKYLPRIANLSLQNNNLRMWRDMDPISSRKEKLLSLRELVLMGNPLRESEYQNGNSERFKREATRRFTTLELLDQEPIAKISFDVAQSEAVSAAGNVTAPSATTFPLPMGQSFIDGVDPSLVSNFLSRFFPAFDRQRPSLGDVYTPASTFSFSANTSIPVRARIEGLNISMPNQRKLEWSPWLGRGSRNLTRISGDKSIAALHIGSDAIVQALVKLPLTKHDILGAPDNFCVDSFLAGVGLLVVVHGQFVEAPSEGIRSFDRTLMLAPAPEGSRAKMNGWDVVILSDQWTIRGFSKPEAWKPGPMLVQATLESNPPPTIRSLPQDQQELLNSIAELQRPLVLQVCGRTGLNVRYSLDCLIGNSWDLERAVANFNEVKATLGQDAFLHVKPRP